jgi:hypothetical protein
MDNVQKPTPEELVAEQAQLALPKEEELRADIIAEYGFDEVEDSERIDKLVAKEIENRKTISTAIKQKIKHREAEDELRKKVVEVKPEPPKKELEFSPKDYLALSQAGVPAEDLDEVTDFAKFKGITLAEALKTPYIVGHLKEKAEERKAAEATNTGGGKRGAFKQTDESLLQKLDEGELPIEDIERAVKARIAERKKGN